MDAESRLSELVKDLLLGNNEGAWAEIESTLAEINPELTAKETIRILKDTLQRRNWDSLHGR